MAEGTRESKDVGDGVRYAFVKYQQMYWLQLVSTWRGECCHWGGWVVRIMHMGKRGKDSGL